MLPDHHTHHLRCGHATGHLTDMVKAAQERGLPAVGLSDHAPLLFLAGDHPRPTDAMARSAFPAYLQEMHDLRQRFPAAPRVMASAELDFVPGSQEAYHRLIADAHLDYTLGSVHWIDGWHLFDRTLPDGWTAEHAWSRALALTREAAAVPDLDVLAHLDVLKTKGHLPQHWQTPELSQTLDAIADSGKAIELNTSGWRKPVGDCFPNRAIVEQAARRGIPICLGSDAHRPEDVGAGFERAARLLWEAGYRDTVTFQGRERRTVPLTESGV